MFLWYTDIFLGLKVIVSERCNAPPLSAQCFRYSGALKFIKTATKKEDVCLLSHLLICVFFLSTRSKNQIMFYI